MRAETPVYQDTNSMWYLTRYDNCVAALKGRRLSSNRTEVRLRTLESDALPLHLGRPA